MEPQKLVELKRIQNFCKENFKRFEFWPAYYDRRFIEFLSYERLFPVKHFGKVLEVGCGNGFYSCLLSTLSDHVTATDLEKPSLEQHSDGFQHAREMIQKMNFSNIDLQAASIESLPFADASFDIVFSSHVLIYLGDKTRALQEVARVLKPGGYHICIVPTRASKLYNLFMFQYYILNRLFYHLVVKHFQSQPNLATAANEAPAAANKKTNYSALKDFPFPPSFGGLPHWRDEFREWSPAAWRGVITQNGKMKLISQTTTQVNPLVPLLGESFHHLSAAIHSLTWRWELWLGRFAFFQKFGLNSVIIVQK